MPLNVRPIATKAAVMSFFVIAIVGWGGRLSAMTCCKRAIIASIVAYVVATMAVKAMNAILISAMTTKQMILEQEKARDSKN